MRTDGWSLRATESYIKLLPLILTNIWNLCDFVLQTRIMPETHTGIIILNDNKVVIRLFISRDSLKIFTKIPLSFKTLSMEGGGGGETRISSDLNFNVNLKCC